MDLVAQRAMSRLVGGLSLAKICGDIRCDPYFYCSEHSSSCNPCESICDERSGNFDASTCEVKCQDFIHDKIKQYLMKSDIDLASGELKSTIENMWKLVAASICLSVLALLALTGVGLIFLLKHRRIQAAKRKEAELIEQKISTVSGMMNNNSKDKPLCLNMPPPGGGGGPPTTNGSNTAAPSVVTQTTPVSTRHPCEDTTLEFAYDNQGMTPSPITATAASVLPRCETTF